MQRNFAHQTLELSSVLSHLTQLAPENISNRIKFRRHAKATFGFGLFSIIRYREFVFHEIFPLFAFCTDNRHANTDDQ